MPWKSKMQQWLERLPSNSSLRKELVQNIQNEMLLEDSFYKDLEFGTAGMRGIMGVGTNRMNKYTVKRAAVGLARYVSSHGVKAEKRGVVIAYDNRYQSSEFALEAARTLESNGINVYLFEELRPTPILSFAIRHLQAYAGIMITASHNPPEYNGLKVYGEDGAQLLPEAAGRLMHFIDSEHFDFTQTKEQGQITYIGDEVDKVYFEVLSSIQLKKDGASDISIVFTPLHGTANSHVRGGLASFGFHNVTVVKEQELPHPEFPTVASPNPEEHEAFTLAIQYGEKVNADILIATDPDADRLGVAVKNYKGQYGVLTGNQLGALMLHYLLTHKRLPADGMIIKTIVTSELGQTIASDFGVKTIDTLTGFKFIAEKIKENKHQFLFGYEESYGYLIGDFVRDKDAVQAAVFASEMAAFYKAQGKSLYEGLMDLFEKYGYYRESLRSLVLTGKIGEERIRDIMEGFRKDPPLFIQNVPVIEIEDYETSERLHVPSGIKSAIDMPSANVLKCKLADGSWFCVRPSGTEPKCKFYFGVIGESLVDSKKRLIALEEAVMKRVGERVV